MPVSSGRTSSPRPAAPPDTPVRDLAALAGADLVPGSAGAAVVTGITHDSRQVRPGDLYAALPGAHVHGADFVLAAVAAGAVAVLTDAAGRDRAAATGVDVLVTPDPRAVLGAVARSVYGAPGDDLLLLGVTGTNGKTTTAYLMESGLRTAGRRTGLIGTVETRVADTVLPSARTTPEAPDLQALLAVMRERGVQAVAMEISSHALALGRVDGCPVDVAVFTNLSQDHLDFHGDMAEYFAAKASLFTPDRARAGVVNLDDPYGEALLAEATVPVTTFSGRGDRRADWRAEEVRPGPAGSDVTVAGPDGARVPLAVPLPGEFNVSNALGAVAALVLAGLPPATAAAGVAACPGVPGRMERVDAGQGFAALVDYAHTPDALTTLLTALRPGTSGRLLVVVGCGGDRDRGKRQRMGAAAARGADVSIFTSDNPRSEDPLDILAAMSAGVRDVPPAHRGEVLVEVNRREAVALAVQRARPGDTVVIAGKGHETGQESAAGVLPFDDRQVLREALLRAGSPA